MRLGGSRRKSFGVDWVVGRSGVSGKDSGESGDVGELSEEGRADPSIGEMQNLEPSIEETSTMGLDVELLEDCFMRPSK